ncbi:MAG: acyltransferase family protein [Clostridia bacterium]|nr:acyltransferase family protein [Clostridia bacterium]
MKQRIQWLDIVKGFLILTVMLGHISQTPEWLKIWIYSFHMPLFFFLSGVTFSIEKYDFKTFIKRKIRTLIVPGLVFEFIQIIINVAMGKLQLTVKNIILGIILQMRGQGTDIAWFLVALFISEIVLYLVIKLLQDKTKKIVPVLFLSAIINFLYLRIAVNFLSVVVLPYSMDLVFLILPFIYAGYLYKNNRLKVNENKLFILLYIIMGNSLCFISFKILGYHFDLDLDKIGSFTLYYLTAFAQISWLLILFKKIKKAKVLSFIGKNSMVFYVWHTIVFSIFDEITRGKIEKEYAIIGLKMITSIIVLTILTGVVNKYFQFVLGRKKEIK